MYKATPELQISDGKVNNVQIGPDTLTDPRVVGISTLKISAGDPVSTRIIDKTFNSLGRDLSNVFSSTQVLAPLLAGHPEIGNKFDLRFLASGPNRYQDLGYGNFGTRAKDGDTVGGWQLYEKDDNGNDVLAWRMVTVLDYLLAGNIPGYIGSIQFVLPGMVAGKHFYLNKAGGLDDPVYNVFFNSPPTNQGWFKPLIDNFTANGYIPPENLPQDDFFRQFAGPTYSVPFPLRFSGHTMTVSEGLVLGTFFTNAVYSGPIGKVSDYTSNSVFTYNIEQFVNIDMTTGSENLCFFEEED